MKKVAEEVGVSRTTLYEWQKIELYMLVWNNETLKNFRACGANIRRSHVKHALKSGNPGLYKLFYQVAEGFSEKSEVTEKLDYIERPHKDKTTAELKKDLKQANSKLSKRNKSNGEGTKD